ncbi:unnamed protein product, partial [Phaeothamnion confervicola]
FPSVFLILSKIRCIFEAALPPTRPMDNVPLGFDLPQEDEVANMILTGGLSPFLLFFYQKKPHVKRLLDCLDFYRGADGQRPQSDAPTNKYYRRWEKCWLHFLRKVSFAGGADEKRLLLKSPAHTARVRVLLKLFPNAQFIYVHRNP